MPTTQGQSWLDYPLAQRNGDLAVGSVVEDAVGFQSVWPASPLRTRRLSQRLCFTAPLKNGQGGVRHFPQPCTVTTLEKQKRGGDEIPAIKIRLSC